MADSTSDDEAAWRDLVAHYGDPAAAGDGPSPWPAQEDLPEHPAPAPTGSRPKPSGPLQASRDASRQAPGEADPAGSDTRGSDTGGNSDTSNNTDTNNTNKNNDASDNPVPGVFPAMPQFRIVRPAASAPPWEDAVDPDDEGHYVPPEPPPLPHLDSVSKGAWVAVFGGPAYLMVAVMAGWTIPGWAGLAAVAAFIGGFATLVLRMGDRPPTDSGPDDGAVV